MIKVTLITILSLQILILSILLLLRKENRLANSLLGLVLFFFGLTTIHFSLFQGLFYEQLLDYIPYLRLELLYGLGPSLYLYTRSVTNSEYKFRKKDLLLFVPVLIEFIYYRTSFYREGANQLGVDSLNTLQLVFTIQQWLGFIYSTVFMLFSVYILFRYKKWLYNNFSYTKNISLEWIHIPIMSFVIFWFIWFTIRITDIIVFSGSYSETYFFPMYIVLSLITLWIGFKGYTNSKTGASGFNSTSKLQGDSSAKIIPEYKRISETLLSKMEFEKYYLNQNLSLKILSEETGIQKSILSKTINHSFGINFHEFVNRYRVKEFIKRIEADKTKQFTFLAHAYESGFASKSSFNYVFKKQTNKTPKEYFSELQEKQE
jgi:AraC-like DNA-binding protein